MIKWVTLLLAMLLALSGCTRGPSQSIDTTSSATSTVEPGTATKTSSDRPTIPQEGPPLNIEWSDCEGIGLFLHATALMHNGTVPPGWEAPASSALGGIQLILYECQRISWGNFERGPVHVLHEWHAEFAEPASCNQEGEDYDLRSMIEAIWLDDSEIVEFAQRSFGLPARYAEFSFSSTPVGDAEDLAWTFQVPGQEASTIHFLDVAPDINHTTTTDYRLYWYNGVGVGYLSLLEVFESGDEPFDLAYGTLAPPTLYGEGTPTHEFATPAADVQAHANMSATIHRFSDLQCKNPL